jgi:hypothetical protein
MSSNCVLICIGANNKADDTDIRKSVPCHKTGGISYMEIDRKLNKDADT